MPEHRPPDVLATLTDREREVLALIGEGMSLGEIAAQLHRSVETIKSHRRSLARKLGTPNRVRLAQLAVRCGLTSGETPPTNVPSTTATGNSLLGEGAFHSKVKAIRCSADLTVRAVNSAACEWLQRSSTQVEGTNLLKLPIAAGAQDLAEMCRLVLESDAPESRLMVVEDSQGSSGMMRVDISPIPVAGVGELPDLWITIQDTGGVGTTPADGERSPADQGVPFDLLRREAEARRRAEARLGEVLAGVSSTGGPTSFRQLARHLCRALDVEHVILSARTSRDVRSRNLSVIAGWSHGAPMEPFDFDPSKDPCGEAMLGKMNHVPAGVSTLYPEAEVVKKFRPESFLAIPLTATDGSVIGVLSLLSDRPMPDVSEDVVILRAFASRAACELERLEAESELHSAVGRHERLADICPVGLYYCDSDGRCIYVSRRSAEIIGRGIKQCLNGGWLQAVHPSDREEVARGYRERAAGRADLPAMQYRFLHPDGSIVTVIDEATRDLGDNETFEGWIGALTVVPKPLCLEAPGGVR